MKILITGGAGFIGSHLAERLIREGHEITVADDLNGYYSPDLKRDNLAEIGETGRFEFVHCDVRDEERIERLFRERRFEAVVHLAARAGVRPSLDEPLLYESVNIRGTMVLLEASRKHGVKKFVFASSSSIYGVANHSPFREDDWNTMPISPYAATKMAGERIGYVYSHLYGLSVACLRFFTVYGPRQRPDLAIRKFTSWIDAGRPIPVYGDGSSSRDYTYVDDTVQGIAAAIRHDTLYDVFNLGNSSPVSLTTLIGLIESNLGKKAIIQRLPDQPGDVPTTCADITKAESLLGYRPRTPLAAGIRKFVEWHQAQKAVRVVPVVPAA